MLKQRIITAVALALLFLFVLFGLPAAWFGALLLVIVAACAWEWTALCALKSPVHKLSYVVSVTLVAFLIMLFGTTALIRLLALAGVLIWIVIALDLYRQPISRRLTPDVLRLCSAALIVIVASVCMFQVRQGPGGAGFVLYMVALVACADIGAYFAGKKFGVKKLAPQISAGKTIEGVIGGMLLALYCNVFTAQAFANSQTSAKSIFLMATLAAMVSVVGDLYVSRAKRVAEVKDSGHMLPGHGGVLDRFDGLLAAVPWMTFALLWL